MPDNKVRISFICPVYNSGDTVKDAVESILDQDLEELEVILVDDGSNNSTKRVLRRLEKLPKVKVLYQPHEGACKARNTGARIARGDYFSFLPSDARLYPDVARRWVEVLDENPDFGFLYGGYKFFDPEGIYQESVFWSQPFDNFFHDQYPYIDGSFPLRREVFPWDNNGGWDSEIISLQDWDFWMAVIKQKKAKGIYAKDIFFETIYPKKGGLSFDSHNNWLSRVDAIKKKWGIEETPVCVTGPGAPFHAMNIAKTLGYDYRTQPAMKPHRFDTIYTTGYYPSLKPSTEVFANFPGQKIIHWVGTDIWQLLNMGLVQRKQLVDACNQFVDVHLVEFRQTYNELRELGFDMRKVKIVPLPPRSFYPITPLPEKFTVA